VLKVLAEAALAKVLAIEPKVLAFLPKLLPTLLPPFF
jgi:hypothetical protein